MVCLYIEEPVDMSYPAAIESWGRLNSCKGGPNDPMTLCSIRCNPNASAWRGRDPGGDKAETCTCWQCLLPPVWMIMPMPAGDDSVDEAVYQLLKTDGCKVPCTGETNNLRLYKPAISTIHAKISEMHDIITHNSNAAMQPMPSQKQNCQ